MIEVERKFQPTEEQLQKLLEGAEFKGEEEIIEIFYDTPDYRYRKNNILLRSRNGKFDLKVDVKDAPKITSKLRREIEDEKGILKELGFDEDTNFSEMVKNNLIILCQCVTKRRSYKNGEFGIDIDECDFGYHICEIELLIESNDKIIEAEKKIINFASQFGLIQVTDIISKSIECLKVTKPDIYEKIFGNDEKHNELKMK